MHHAGFGLSVLFYQIGPWLPCLGPEMGGVMLSFYRKIGHYLQCKCPEMGGGEKLGIYGMVENFSFGVRLTWGMVVQNLAYLHIQVLRLGFIMIDWPVACTIVGLG